MNRAEKRRRQKLAEKAAQGKGGADQALQIAKQHHVAGQLPQAEIIYKKVLQTNPDHFDALNLLGVLSQQVGKADMAVELITRALAIRSDYEAAHFNLGITLQGLGRLEEAAASYRKAIAIKPDYEDAHNNLGNVLIEFGCLEDAVVSLGKAVDLNPGNPEVHSNLGNVQREMGDTENAVSSYQKAIALNPNLDIPHNNLGLIYRELGRLDDAVAYFRKAIALNPGFAEAHNSLAIALREQGQLDEAVECDRKAIAINPNFAEAYNNLGASLKELGQLDEAVASFEKAISLRPDDAKAHFNLGIVRKVLGTMDVAVASFQTAIIINPDYAEAHHNLGTALKEMGQRDEAMACYRKAITINPNYAKGFYNLGAIQLLTGDLEHGWKNLDYRWRSGDRASYFRKYSQPLWQGEDISGKRILLWEEQGIGDSILYAGTFSDLLEDGVNVSLECDARLVPLFSRSFPEVSCAPMNKETLEKAAFDDFDFHTPFGNLGRWLRPNLAAFPCLPSYLVADEEQRQTLRMRYLERGNDFLVGIAWYSKNPNCGEKKSMTLPDIQPLLETTGVTFVDLQYGDTAVERDAFKEETGIEVFHDAGFDQLLDLDTFASQVAAMDLVITISNTTAHMAGALGVSTLLMLGNDPIWYWMLERPDSPWYPSLKLFRQHKQDNWKDVIDQVRKALLQRL